ncbi:MAG: helix-turn-helix transcriptional regulator [Succinivibrio sp.]|nr:helix-turn-helix transcriptional regulator [Succinivibrio sp.]
MNLPNFPSIKLITKLKTYYPNLNETSSKDVEQSLIYVITGFKKEFGENLRKFRTSTGMTQTTASNLFQVTLAAYSQWETGKISPRPTKVEEICKALNIDPADLINVNPVSSEAIYDRRVPILSLDFFKAKTFGSAFREFHNQDISCSEKVKADEYGKYDYAVRVTNTDMVSDRVSLPNGGIALCSWKDLMGKEPLEQMQVADGTLALVSIVYNTVVFREVHFDGKFLTLKCWNKDQEENRFPLKLGDEALLDDPEQAKFAGIVTPASYIQIFGIVKKCLIDYENLPS